MNMYDDIYDDFYDDPFIDYDYGSFGYNESQTINGIKYNRGYRGKSFNVIGIEDNVTDIIIPDCIDGVPVERWSLDKNETEKIKNFVRSIDFGSIKEFGYNSFTGFNKLESVVMSSQVIRVPLFDNCKILKSFIIKNGSTLDSINERTFYGCDILKEIILPYSLKSYASFIFEYTPSIKNIKFVVSDNRFEEIEIKDVEKEIIKRHRKQRIDKIKNRIKIIKNGLSEFSWEGLPFLISLVILIGIIVYHWHDIFSYQHSWFDSLLILAAIIIIGGVILLVVAFCSGLMNVAIKEKLSTDNFFLGVLSSILSFPLSSGICFLLLFLLAQCRSCFPESDDEDEEPIHIRWDGRHNM